MSQFGILEKKINDQIQCQNARIQMFDSSLHLHIVHWD